MQRIEAEISTDVLRTSVALEQEILTVGDARYPDRLTPARLAVARHTVMCPDKLITMTDFRESLPVIRSRQQIFDAVSALNRFYVNVTEQAASPWQLTFDGPVLATKSGDTGVRNLTGVMLASNLQNGVRKNMLPSGAKTPDRSRPRPQEIPPKPLKSDKLTPEELFRTELLRATLNKATVASDLMKALRRALPYMAESEIRDRVATELRSLKERGAYAVTYAGGTVVVRRAPSKLLN